MRGQNWTKILAEAGLEAPGYKEAKEQASRDSAAKKERERLREERKKTGGRKARGK